jgi:(p)ppGpp synthase/HD superfamily hydrolase
MGDLVGLPIHVEIALKKTEEILLGPMTLDKAILLATIYHARQQDKGQNAYIRHPLRVMEKMQSEDEMIPAVLHDVIEDTKLTLDDLRKFGLTETQVKTVDALTKRPGEEYAERVDRACRGYAARKIKTADIKDNLRIDRIKNRKLTNKDLERMQHYIDALHQLGTYYER